VSGTDRHQVNELFWKPLSKESELLTCGLLADI
jgi:hypothetical protein